MAKKDKEKKDPIAGEEVQEQVAEEATETPEVNPWEEKYNAEHDQFLRLAAEFDNFRKRTIKEKEASYGNGRPTPWRRCSLCMTIWNGRCSSRRKTLLTKRAWK